MHTTRVIVFTLAFGVLTAIAAAAQSPGTPEAQQTASDRTPPRLSFADGQVSFWRPGAQEWAAAQVNTPLAPGDELYTGSPGNLELQIGSRAFVRGWANTQLGLANQEPSFLQFKLTIGFASFDLRTLEPGTTVEVATPNAALTIEHAGYYRVDVTGERTAFTTRRGGQATVTPASGAAVVITPSEEVVIEGTSSPQVTSYAAPQLDNWDKWNYARSETQLDAMSARYVSPGTYGVRDLDRYGTWRAVPTYGTVWVPTAVQPGWAPYTTGSWTFDPTYGWTWVDTAPWGWAPYHHGRWVSVNGFWGWAPGPVVARPVYAPALVAFLGGPSVRVSVNIGGPVLGWVALGWGEPLVPWWGRPGFAHVPTWGGWGGPRVVNNVVINNTTVVNVQNINVYNNTRVQNAVVVVNENRFGRGPITGARVTQVDVKSLQPTHAGPQVTATAASFVPTATRGVRPPEESLKRAVVATRPPQAGLLESAGGGERKAGPPGTPTPAPRIVSAPPRHEGDAAPARPPLGESKLERRLPDRAQPVSPPKPPEGRQAAPARREPRVAAPSPDASQSPPAPTTAPPARPAEKPQVAAPSMGVPPSPRAPATAPPAPARAAEQPRVAVPPPAAPATAPPASPRRPEKPQVATPVAGVPPSPGAPATPPLPPARPAEQPRVAAPPPAAPASTPSAPPRRPEKPQVAAPSPGAPATPPAPPARPADQPRVTAPPPAAPATPPAPPARPAEQPRVTAPPPAAPATPPAPPVRPAEQPRVTAPTAAAPTAHPAPPRRPEKPQVAAPPAGAPPSPAGPPTAPPPSARRPEAAAQPVNPPLPGEPANRLSPHRAPKDAGS
jgi:hypothetical protein